MAFSRIYRCNSTTKVEVEQGNKILLPSSALVSLLSLDNMRYPMMFQLVNPSTNKMAYCGVLEFTSEEGTITLPKWMMQTLDLEDGGIMQVMNVALVKGTYVKLQPHSKDFLDIANPKAVLEKTLRNYACLNAGGSIVIYYNDRSYHIDVLETKPRDAVHIVDTDCEVDFAPPLDYEQPQNEYKSACMNETKCITSKSNGKLVFGSANAAKNGSEVNGAETVKKEDSKKFQAFTGKKYTLRG